RLHPRFQLAHPGCRGAAADLRPRHGRGAVHGRLDRDQHRRRHPHGEGDGTGAHHRHGALRLRQPLPVEDLQPGLPAREGPAGAGMAGAARPGHSFGLRGRLTPMRALRALLLILALAVLAMPGAAPLWAQENGQAEEAVNYEDWEKAAARAEEELESRDLTEARLEELRGQMAGWRAALSTAQSANSARIATVKEQIAALGPAPAEGETEAEEISARRKELADRLVKLQAPGIAADEAYRRADGLIREIDRILRERQADALLRLWPSPLNPGNWPEAAVGLSDTVMRLWYEGSEAWDDRQARERLVDNLPLIFLLLAVWAGLSIYARRWIDNYAERLQQRGGEMRRRVLSVLASLGLVVVPVLGVVALTSALRATGMLGEVGTRLNDALPVAGFLVFFAAW